MDLVVAGIAEPVRFRIETRAKIFPLNERFWYFTKKPHQELFYLTVKDADDKNSDEEVGDSFIVRIGVLLRVSGWLFLVEA